MTISPFFTRQGKDWELPRTDIITTSSLHTHIRWQYLTSSVHIAALSVLYVLRHKYQPLAMEIVKQFRLSRAASCWAWTSVTSQSSRSSTNCPADLANDLVDDDTTSFCGRFPWSVCLKTILADYLLHVFFSNDEDNNNATDIATLTFFLVHCSQTAPNPTTSHCRSKAGTQYAINASQVIAGLCWNDAGPP